ncbi:hypothetical protein [Leucobacter soli]
MPAPGTPACLNGGIFAPLGTGCFIFVSQRQPPEAAKLQPMPS